MIRAILAVAMVFAQFGAAAQTFPVKPVRVIIGNGPGTSPDIQMRILAEKLAAEWKQQLVIENMPGASGNIAAERVLAAPPDGYTLFYASIGPLAINMHLYSKLSYDIVRDFAPVTQVSRLSNLLLVHPSLPPKSVKELIALARKRPGELRYGSGGNGTSLHLAGEMLKVMAAINILHVPYKTSPQMTTDLIGGHLDLAFHNSPVAMPHVQSGRLRALAVTSDRRQPYAPELPTVAEAGVPGFEITIGGGLVAPRRVPEALIEKINADLQRALHLPEIKDAYTRNYLEITARAPKEFATWQKAEIEKMGKLVRASGAKLD